ncbi:MAG: sulfotransferase domain-containing protein, partial [Candidatus Latescibacterota bacterium]
MNTEAIYIVSGLPRSGTSMAMALLQAGGVELIADGVRKADEDNLGGYFEYEAVKGIRNDVSWVYAARGKA